MTHTVTTKTLQELHEALTQDDVKRAKLVLSSIDKNIGRTYKCEYFAQYDDMPNQFVFIDHPSDDWDYVDFRVFIGHLSNMKQVRIKKMVGFRGGPSIFNLEDGTKIKFPTVSNKEDVATHKDCTLNILPPDITLSKNLTFLD